VAAKTKFQSCFFSVPRLYCTVHCKVIAACLGIWQEQVLISLSIPRSYKWEWEERGLHPCCPFPFTVCAPQGSTSIYKLVTFIYKMPETYSTLMY